MAVIKRIVMFLIEICIMIFQGILLYKVTNSLVLTIGLIYILWILGGFIYAFGIFISGKILSLDFKSFSFGPVILNKDEGKINIRLDWAFATPGACSMITKKNTIKELIIYGSGGIIMNIFVIILFLRIVMLGGSSLLDVVGKVIIINGIYSVIYNGVPYLADNSHGSKVFDILFRKGINNKMESFMEYTRKSKSGIRPREIEGEFDYNDIRDGNLAMLIAGVNYYKALDEKDMNKVLECIEFIEEKIKRANIAYANGFSGELIYYYSAIEKNSDKAEEYFFKHKNYLLNDSDMNGRRKLASYYFYIKNDKERARKYCLEALFKEKSFIDKGQGLLERDIVNKILQDIDKSEVVM